MNKKYSMTIGWLYPDLMNIYGDRGNIIVLLKRCLYRGIKPEIREIGLPSTNKDLAGVDFLFGGGAQDSQQTIVFDDLKKNKSKVLHGMIEDGIPGLYICGAYQFLGKYYKEADGTVIDGLGIFDLHTVNPGEKYKRLIGNIIADLTGLFGKNIPLSTIVGFENHGGRTYLGQKTQPLGKVVKGFGNNGNDSTEGAVYNNSIGTYMHGPILPKNPHMADFLIKLALEKKYKTEIVLEPLDDTLAYQAHNAIINRLL